MASEQAIFEIDDKIRPASHNIANSLTRAGGILAYVTANNTLADIPDTDDIIPGTDTGGRKGVRGSDVHLIVGLLTKIKAVVTPEDMAAVLRVAVNVGA